jgi:hypothetical protein
VIRIDKTEQVPQVCVNLSDAMVNLDQPVRVVAGDVELFKGVVPRTIGRLQATLASRGDPDLLFPAQVTVRIP